MLDALDRPLRDLRISVTDRCNFRCVYCMPREVFGAGYAYSPRESLLTFEEIARAAAAFVALGVEKIRLTGGEPLLRRDLEHLVTMLARLGVRDLALTTNGSLLTPDRARALADSGLNRVTISLDTLDPATFRRMADTDADVGVVLDAIEAADAAGLRPVKIDVVVRRGLNESSVLPIAEKFRWSGITVRFIEYMDVGGTNRWRREDVFSVQEILALLGSRWPLEPAESSYFGEVAERWRYADGAGEVGMIGSITQPFCRSCTRARLSAEGELFTCLFAARGTALRELLRGGGSDEELRERIRATWGLRDDRYSELRAEQSHAGERVEMSRIGG